MCKIKSLTHEVQDIRDVDEIVTSEELRVVIATDFELPKVYI